MKTGHSINKIYKTLKDKGIDFISNDVLVRLFEISRNYAAQIIYRMKKQRLIEEVEKGKYIVKDAKDKNPITVSVRTITPSYLSFRTALIQYSLVKEDEGKEIYILQPLKGKAL